MSEWNVMEQYISRPAHLHLSSSGWLTSMSTIHKLSDRLVHRRINILSSFTHPRMAFFLQRNLKVYILRDYSVFLSIHWTCLLPTFSSMMSKWWQNFQFWVSCPFKLQFHLKSFLSPLLLCVIRTLFWANWQSSAFQEGGSLSETANVFMDRYWWLLQ